MGRLIISDRFGLGFLGESASRVSDRLNPFVGGGVGSGGMHVLLLRARWHNRDLRSENFCSNSYLNIINEFDTN